MAGRPSRYRWQRVGCGITRNVPSVDLRWWVLTVAFQRHVVRGRRVIQRERDVVRLRQVQHGLHEQVSRVVKHGDGS